MWTFRNRSKDTTNVYHCNLPFPRKVYMKWGKKRVMVLVAPWSFGSLGSMVLETSLLSRSVFCKGGARFVSLAVTFFNPVHLCRESDIHITAGSRRVNTQRHMGTELTSVRALRLWHKNTKTQTKLRLWHLVHMYTQSGDVVCGVRHDKTWSVSDFARVHRVIRWRCCYYSQPVRYMGSRRNLRNPGSRGKFLLLALSSLTESSIELEHINKYM